MNLFLTTLLICLAIVIPVTIAIIIIYHFFLRSVIEKSLVYRYRDPLTDLMATLQVIIQTEERLYDEYIFNYSETGSMTNAQYENAYQELCTRILNGISEDMWKQFEFYMKRETIATFITESVQIYLKNKIGSTSL